PASPARPRAPARPRCPPSCRGRSRQSRTGLPPRRAPRARAGGTCRRRRGCGGGGRSPRGARGGRRRGPLAPARPPLALDEGALLASQQVEVLPLLAGELATDLLARVVLEPLPVLPGEPVRPALAADAAHQRLLIVHAAHQALGALGE